MELEEGDVHEDEAGWRIAHAAAGEGVVCRSASEGRVDLFASCQGLLKVNVQGLQELNLIPETIMASRSTNTPVLQGEKLAATRVIPQVTRENTVTRGEMVAKSWKPLVEVQPYLSYQIKVIVTGREVYEGKVEDAFAPAIQEKAFHYGLRDPDVYYVPDEAEEIASKITEVIDKSQDAQSGKKSSEKVMLIITGGMSVDPDDVTPEGIRLSGAAVEKYGTPVLPGAMFMVAYLGEVPILGMPACGMFFRTTVLDLVIPRLLTGEAIKAPDLAALGHGGLCLGCKECTYPYCPFGKGGLPYGS